jgi:sulfatase modifying factor 1
MQTEIIVKDELRAEVEAASGGKQTIIRTAKGQPSYFNIIPRADMPGHPAFHVGGVEKSELFLGTYQATIRDGEALSLPGEDPTTNINYDRARAACLACGPGFHLLTNLEWALVAHLVSTAGNDVRGNTNWGKSHSHPEERGTSAKGSNRTLTGSGPDAWRHDGTPHGIADLVGNVWEWVDGLKLVSGQIIMPADNDFNLPEAEWLATGVCIDLVNGEPVISSKVTNRGWNGRYFKDVISASGFEVPASIKQALLCPTEGSQVPGYYWADNSEGFEGLPIRGGDWHVGSGAGLGALGLLYGRSFAHSLLGFRPAFIA